MKYDAWVANAPKQPIVLETVDVGPLGAEDVEVAVEHCGLCHSDLSLLHDDWGISQYPAILGHEVVGRVTALGQGFGASHVVSSKDSAAITKPDGRFDLLISTVNVTLDWDAMIGTLAPNGRLHVVGAVLEPIPVPTFPLILQQRSFRVRRLARRWRSRRCSTLPHGTTSRRRPSTSR
jgi:D-arabinose 1-dehydrogenase-like Zn-dependent alcohol dehydrogenase